MARPFTHLADRPWGLPRGRADRWLTGWLSVLLTLLIAGGSCWAILALNRAADRTQQAEVTLAEIQRNAQNAENLFSRSLSAPPPGRGPRLPGRSAAPPPGPPPPPPGGFSPSALQADNVALLNSLRSTVGDRDALDAVGRELMALNNALRPLAGPGGPQAAHIRGQQVVVRLQQALGRLSGSVAARRSEASELSNDGTLAIALLAALIVAAMLRHFDRRRRRDAEEHTNELRAQALRDPLTGLANRRQLNDDLALAARQATSERPVRLMLFDLDGFKDYNDAYGHHEGDLLLSRIARSLGAAVAPFGRAYRLGGDEFCALISNAENNHGDELDVRFQESLASSGEGFSIQASVGSVLLPNETGDPETAMQWADARMYANKDSGHLSAGQQTRNVALNLLAVQEPDIFKHSERVAGLAGAVGARLGISGQALPDLTRAAELHDIGKVAIPFAVLEKRGPLNDEEWELMRRHSIIGANILRVAPSLLRVATIVRSSHERFDGQGYPDGLVGNDIPLASRIVFACDCFDAMTSNRAYRAALPEEQAIAELTRCAGAQFDPVVVAALEECWREGLLPKTASALRSTSAATQSRKQNALRVGARTIPAR
jgi:diguanylate cyclase (GGDEF)-like protein